VPRTVDSRYLQIAERLRDETLELGSNALLPSELQLARRFGVSRVTIRRALGLLERAGLLSRQRGRGTLVNPPKLLRRPLAFTLDDDLRRQAARLDTRVLHHEPEVTAPELVRRELGLAPRATVQFLSVLRLVDDRVIAHEARYFALPVAKPLDLAALHERPISALLAEVVGVPITRLDWEMEFTPASREIAAVLGVTPGILIAASTYTQYLETGWPVETGVVSYRIDRVRFRFSSGDAPWLVPPGRTWQLDPDPRRSESGRRAASGEPGSGRPRIAGPSRPPRSTERDGGERPLHPGRGHR
jgi:GntR family transcriptional regulator